MTLIDTHAHLEQIKDLAPSLAQAQERGVVAIIGVGVDLSSNHRNLEIKKEFTRPRIYVALGIHPSEVHKEDIEKSLDFIQENLVEAVAVGEIGLDFWYKWARKNSEIKDLQKDVFRRQLSMAQKFDLPVIIHSRGAWKVCLEMVRDLDLHKGVFHWYSGPLDVLEGILEQGFYISATPSLAYSPQARDAVRQAPMERILLETDSPVFYRDRENEDEGFRSTPQDVFRTLDRFARLRSLDAQEAARISCENARRLFGIDDTE